MTIRIAKPNKEIIAFYLSIWNSKTPSLKQFIKDKINDLPKECQNILDNLLEDINLKKYNDQETSLNLLINNYNSNNKLENILLKSSVINDFYGTNIFSIYEVAKKIHSITNFDELLLKGDPKLVNKMKEVNNHSFYSFSTKYCSFHEPLKYPIYDSNVDNVLWYFKNNKYFNSSSFKNRKSLKDYETFKTILDDFLNEINTTNKTNYNYKEIDHYLWLLGKIYFPKPKEKE